MFVVREKRVRCAAVQLLLLAMWAVSGAAARRQPPVVNYEDSQYDDVSPTDQRAASAAYYDDEGVKNERTIAKDDDEDVWQASGLTEDRSLFDVDVDDLRKEQKNKIKVEKYDLRHKSKEPNKKTKSRSKEKKPSLNLEDRGKKHHGKKHRDDDLEENADDEFHDIVRNKKKSRKSEKKRSKKHDRGDHQYKSLDDLEDINQHPSFDDKVVIQEARRNKVKELGVREMEDGLDVRDLDDGDISEIGNREHKPRKRLSEKEKNRDTLDNTMMTDVEEYRRTPKNVENSTRAANATSKARGMRQSSSSTLNMGIAVDAVNKLLESSTYKLYDETQPKTASPTSFITHQAPYSGKIAGIVDWRSPPLNYNMNLGENRRKIPILQGPTSRWVNYDTTTGGGPLEVVIIPRSQATTLATTQATTTEATTEATTRERTVRSTVDELKNLKPLSELSRARNRAREVMRKRLINGDLEEPQGSGPDPVICDSIDEALLESASAPCSGGLWTTILCVLLCLLKY